MMKNLDLEEQEQLAELKTWWTMHGTQVLSAILVVAIAAAGWYGWGAWQARRSAEAGDLYESLTRAVQSGDAKSVREANGALLERFGGTRYASLGALLAAKFYFERSELKSARAQLESVVERGDAAELKDLARLRLAQVLLDEKSLDEALKVLEAAHGAAFDAQFAVARGDVLFARNQRAEAKAAYRLALEKSDPKSTPFRDAVNMRLDALGG
jgi:predicted negative regulator of RcsB-dependent stress response